MTRTRLAVLLVVFLVTAAAPAQLHESPEPQRGPFSACTYWECCYQCSPVMCWTVGYATGNRAKKCDVTCDLGTCWCEFTYYCYSI